MKLNITTLCLCLATVSAKSIRGSHNSLDSRIADEDEELSRRLGLFDPDMSISTTSSTTSVIPTDCEAETNPPQGWSCDDFDLPWLGLPSSHSNCKNAEWGNMKCSTGKAKLHQKCGQDGVKETHHEYKKGTIEASMSVEVGGVGTTVSGSVEYEEGETSEVTFTDGANGCGECVTWWMHGLVCKKVWKYQTWDPIYGTPVVAPSYPFLPIIGYQCNWREKTVECTKLYGPSSAMCDRTCE